MRNDAQFQKVVLDLATVGGQLEIYRSRFTDRVNMNRLNVIGDLLIKDAHFTEVNGIGATVGGRFKFSKGSLSHLDLSGAQVHSEFEVSLDWGDAGKLVLRDVEVGVLNNLPWPKTLEMTGFSYRQLGGLMLLESPILSDSQTCASTDNLTCLKKWLEKQERYSPQPYKQLATAMREAGRSGLSRDILYANKERERSQSGVWSFIWLTLLKLTVGYGYHFERIFYSLIILVGLGSIVVIQAREEPILSAEAERGRLRTDSQEVPDVPPVLLLPHVTAFQRTRQLSTIVWHRIPQRLPLAIAYSVDMLLPIIKLRELHYTGVELSGWERYYFFLHQLAGYLLVIAFAAAIPELLNR